MILNELFNLSELSPGTLASYKKKAGADASAADVAGDYARGNKRFSGIVKATKKQFANDTKGVAEGAAKFDPKTGLPASGQLSEFGGDATQFGTPTQSTPTTEQPPRRGYSIILTGKPGRDWMAEYAWQALEKVFPREYPGNSSVSNYSGDTTVTPAMRKVLEVANRGSAVAKTGITSEDIAETLVAKLAANRVPAQYWRITSEDLDEGVTEGINDRGFFNNVEQWHEAKSDIEHDDQWETPKFIVVKNNGETVAKWSKADNYGWVDPSQQGVAEGIGQQLGIDQLAAISDEALDKAYGYGRSTPGNTFGWQANLKSAAYAKQVIDAGVTDIEKISDAIHKGWNVTAKAFVQNPDQFADTEKLKAAGKLEAKLAQRAKLMNIGYSQLPDDEQEKDRVVARALLSALTGQQGVTEGNLEEIDRRGFLQGLGAAALGAAGISASGNAQARGKPEFMAQLGKARELLSKGLTPDQVAKQMGITGPNHGKSGPMIGDGWAAINYAAQQSKSNRQQAADIQEQGVAEGYNGEYDDEAGMADNNLETLKRAVEGIDDVISAGDNLPEWCQEKIAVSKSMLVAVWDYMRSEEESEEDPESSELQFMLNSAGLGGNR